MQAYFDKILGDDTKQSLLETLARGGVDKAADYLQLGAKLADMSERERAEFIKKHPGPYTEQFSALNTMANEIALKIHKSVTSYYTFFTLVIALK